MELLQPISVWNDGHFLRRKSRTCSGFPIEHMPMETLRPGMWVSPDPLSERTGSPRLLNKVNHFAHSRIQFVDKFPACLPAPGLTELKRNPHTWQSDPPPALLLLLSGHSLACRIPVDQCQVNTIYTFAVDTSHLSTYAVMVVQNGIYLALF